MQFFHSFKRTQIDMSTADELAATFRTNAQMHPNAALETSRSPARSKWQFSMDYEQYRVPFAYEKNNLVHIYIGYYNFGLWDTIILYFRNFPPHIG